FYLIDAAPQIKSSRLENTSNGFKLNLEFKSEPYTIKTLSGKPTVEYTHFMDEGAPGSPVLPKKIIYMAVPPGSTVKISEIKEETSFLKNVEISLNKKTEAAGDSLIIYKESLPDLKYFASDIFPSSEMLLLGYIWIRNYYCAVVQVNTHSYNWKKREIKEITKVELKVDFLTKRPFEINNQPDYQFDEVLRKVIINYDYASGYRSFPFRSSSIDSSGNWIDYSQEYIKLAIPEDGIYRITYNDLVNYGINPAEVNPALIKIFYKGKQIPLYIGGGGDFSFGVNNYIQFYAQKNYGSPEYRRIVEEGEDYLNYMDRYNDTSFIWLSWKGAAGLRADSISSLVPGLSDTLTSHLVKFHFENDERLWYYDAVLPRVQLPSWQENKVWTWLVVSGGSKSSFSFSSGDFVPNTPVKTYARIISNASDIVLNAHSYGSSLNSGSPADTIVFNFKQTVNLSSTYNSNLLVPGENTYKIFGFTTQANFQQALIDWIDIDFYRWNSAQNDSLLLIVPDSVISSLRILKLSNISSDTNIILYKIKPEQKRVTSYRFSSGTLIFSDTVRGGDTYLLVNKNYLKSPGFLYKKQFVNLRDPGRGADYIIVSNKELKQSVTDYKNFISSSYAVRAELVFIDDIYDEFAYGNNDAESVKQFLLSAARLWQGPMPAYVNFIGDANYDYKKIVIPPDKKIRKNLVPSFGNPVSDTWYAAWDTLNINIPQIFTGRIPASNDNEVYYYLQKHQMYLNRGYDDWNKRYLFFSGGDVNDSLQLEQIKQVNENLLNNVVTPAPVGGTGIHFYKTIHPLTNLGPYSQAEINEAVGKGGLFISYIGHSGTQTWDNGINSVSNLKNNYTDRSPLITDFGCSTGKFAEPDYDSFGELFIISSPDGQAINYCGNSSWGYLSTSLRFPELFYKKLLLDTVLTVGKAHTLAKIEQFGESGYSDVNRVFNYCNFLFGDPIIGFRTPVKPNFRISESSFEIIGPNPNDQSDSAHIRIWINNFGRVSGDSLSIFISDKWQNSNFELNKKIPVPLFIDSILAAVPVKGKVGEHTLTAELDKPGLIDEIYENDNTAEFKYTVYSTSIRPVLYEKYFNSFKHKLRLLNPTLFLPGMPQEMLVSVSTDPEFSNNQNFTAVFDTFFTDVQLSSLAPSERYWLRAKLNSQESQWSDVEVYSLRNLDNNLGWFADDSYNKGFDYQNTTFDSSKNAWKLNSSVNTLAVYSAGSDDGEYASVLFNGAETLPNTFFWGIATAEIDTLTLKPENFKFFVYSDNATADDSLIYYLNSLPQGKVVLMTLCADAAQSVLGFSKGTEVRRTIEGFGSLYADSVAYRDSWCLIGKKGAPPGTVPEAYSKRGFGEVRSSISKLVNFKTGKIIFPIISNSAEWINFTKKDSLPSGSSINYFAVGTKSNGQSDTLPDLSFSGNTASLQNINPVLYPEIRVGARLNSNEQFESPFVISVGVNFNGVPELGVNYQTVSVDNDTVQQGQNVNLKFAVYNAGGSGADSFNVKVEVIKPDNSIEIILDEKVASLSPDQKKAFDISYSTLSTSGRNSFNILIDDKNSVKELFEDNNFYSQPFFVSPDTSGQSLTVTFDGSDIFDGEYISSKPDIKIEFSNPSLLTVTDTSLIRIYLNKRRVYFAGNQGLSYEFNNQNPQVVVHFKPELPDDEYLLRIVAKDSDGPFADSTFIEKSFLVSNEVKIIDVFNYPNPVSRNTYFTFKLTQIPDELTIKIYTVAGRLVKEIDGHSVDLKYDFNRLFWDGKDQDGDFIANGVYFYKIILKKGDKVEQVTQKLAVVR
ncbi:MAG TPA: C25 family cysteine peptidase, partial [Ignavibacteriaceae bacterium]|nr:C25 family cysteine peptidase [Ignavibacteriaceae bacterium]